MNETLRNEPEEFWQIHKLLQVYRLYQGRVYREYKEIRPFFLFCFHLHHHLLSVGFRSEITTGTSVTNRESASSLRAARVRWLLRSSVPFRE